jgi:hypothetical protein
MKPLPPPPEGTPIRDRWAQRAAGEGEGEEARFGELFSAAIRRHPLALGQLEAVRARLAAERPGWRIRPWTWQVAIGLLVLLGGGALVAARTGFLRRWMPPTTAAPLRWPAAPAPSERPRPRAGRLVPEPAVAVDEPTDASPTSEAPTPAPREAELSHPSRVASQVASRVASRVAMDGPKQVPRGIADDDPGRPPAAGDGPSEGLASPSPLAEEARLLAAALGKLRQDHDPGAALALLDQHQTRFTNGSLGAEAQLTRVEALLGLDRRDEALSLLDPLRAPWSGRRRDLLITRAELRAQAGRCAEALVDFGIVLGERGSRSGAGSRSEAGSGSDAVDERALHGRASCRSRRGDAGGARADLESYLARFPEGRFAAEARASLRHEP